MEQLLAPAVPLTLHRGQFGRLWLVGVLQMTRQAQAVDRERCVMPWPQWRDGDPDELRKQVNWPVEGVLRAIESNGHWVRAWGARPDTLQAAVARARRVLAEAPRMVPIYAHRFLPAGRGTLGHPVLSMWGTDIIYYGTDLVDYVNYEFEQPRPEHPDGWSPQATVPFWRDYL